MQLISNIKVKECSIISSFKSTSFDMFVTSSYSLGEGVPQVKYPLWKAQKKRYSLIFQELCLYTVLCLNRTRMSIIKKYLHTIKLLNHCISTTEWRPSFFLRTYWHLWRGHLRLHCPQSFCLWQQQHVCCDHTTVPPSPIVARSRSLSTTHTHSKRCGSCSLQKQILLL